MSIGLKTPQDVQGELAARFKARRLTLNLSQEGAAARSGVSWGSLKRFERTGLIGLNALLKLALVLDFLVDFAGWPYFGENGIRMRGLATSVCGNWRFGYDGGYPSMARLR